nr:hypothetical protein [uncultured Tolumonas sp.]
MAIQKIITEPLNEFWSFISPLSDLIDSLETPVFRGHADSEWKLIPSALRINISEKYIHKCQHKNKLDRIILFEYFLLLDYLDEVGLNTPYDSAHFR